MSTLVWNMLLIASLSGAIDVEVSKLDGTTLVGSVVSLSSDEVVVATTAGEETLSARELFSVTVLSEDFPEDEEEEIEQPIAITLTDGSHLRASAFGVEAGRATITLVNGSEVRCATRSIRDVQFKKQNAELRSQWQKIAAAEQSGDILVLRKTTEPGEDDSSEPPRAVLDSLEGVLYDITESTINFDYDGTRVDIPLERIEGVIYLERGARRSVEPVCRLVEQSGTRWNLKLMKMTDSAVTGITASGVRAAVALEQLVEIDYSIGNLVFLSDLQPEKVEWTPNVATNKTPPSVKALYQPQFDQGFFRAPLTLDGQSYEKGLAIHSRTVMQFRLTREFRRFAATAGIDPRFRSAGNVLLSIDADGKTVVSEKIVDGDAPLDIDIDLEGVRRLTVVVDYGDDESDIGDFLNLCNARLMK